MKQSAWLLGERFICCSAYLVFVCQKTSEKLGRYRVNTCAKTDFVFSVEHMEMNSFFIEFHPPLGQLNLEKNLFGNCTYVCMFSLSPLKWTDVCV